MSRTVRSSVLVGVLLLTLALILAGCGGGGEKEEEKKKEEDTKKEDTKAQKGGGGGTPCQIAVEGSSTVLPVTQAAAEGFNQQNPDVEITVGGAGTGDGFEAFCSGEIQIADASRPIKSEEVDRCEQAGIEFIELPIARDGITIAVNPQNDFADNITLSQLRTLWEPSADGQITTWDQVNPEWPSQQINLYGPGTESGTFEFFTEKAVGKAKSSRPDYQASEDDNVLGQGGAGDPNALGYFGFGYFEENQQRLKALTVDGVAPTAESINTGQYPLSRPLLIYVSTQALEENPLVQEFVNYYLDNLDQFVEQAQYVPLAPETAAETRQRFENRTMGSAPEDIGASKTGGKGKEETEKGKVKEEKK